MQKKQRDKELRIDKLGVISLDVDRTIGEYNGNRAYRQICMIGCSTTGSRRPFRGLRTPKHRYLGNYKDLRPNKTTHAAVQGELC